MDITFWGVRGSSPVSGKAYQKGGGNTSCVSIQMGHDLLIFDAGSGIYELGQSIQQQDIKRAILLFSHYHYDHVIGFPFFSPGYDPNFSLTVYGPRVLGLSTIDDFFRSNLFSPPFFPVPFEAMKAKIKANEIDESKKINCLEGVLTFGVLNHPGGAIGYRFERDKKVVCYVSDTEHKSSGLDENILHLIKEADLVIYDATYTKEEYKSKKGWGHSTPEKGIELCQYAKAKQLALFHHAPSHTDDILDEIEKSSQKLWPHVFVAKESMTITL